MSEHKAFDKNFMIKDMVAIVTGGASGIGKATASLFAEKGAKVILFDRSDDVKEVACEISQGASGVKLDITDMKQIDNAISYVISPGWEALAGQTKSRKRNGTGFYQLI